MLQVPPIIIARPIVISLPDVLGLSETTKALIAAGIGLIAGFLLQRVNSAWDEFRKRRKARLDLYGELAAVRAIYNRVAGAAPEQQLEYVKVLKPFTPEMLAYYQEHDKLLLMRLDQAHGIRNMYGAINGVFAKITGNGVATERLSLFMQLGSMFDMIINLGELDGKLLDKLASEHVRGAEDSLKRLHSNQRNTER